MLKYKKPPSKFWGLGLFLPLDLLVLARLNRYPLRRRFIRTFYKKYHLLVVEIVCQSRSTKESKKEGLKVTDGSAVNKKKPKLLEGGYRKASKAGRWLGRLEGG